MLNDLWIRTRSLFGRNKVESELEAELGFHLEAQVDKYVRSGLTREEAQRRARLEFGGPGAGQGGLPRGPRRRVDRDATA